eukprot:282379_1
MGAVLFLILWFFLYILLCKTWMIYYNFKWTTYTLQYEWEAIINPKSNETNFYFNNRQKYGSVVWVAKRLAFIFFVLFVFSNIATSLIFGDNDYIVSITGVIILILTIFLPIGSYIVILCKTPALQKCNDIFYIHWESKIIAKILLLFSLLFVMMFILIAIILSISNEFNIHWIYSLGFVPIASCLAAIIYVSSKLVVQKNMQSQLHYESAKEAKEQSITISRVPSISKGEKSSNPTFSLRQILSTKDTVHLFMLHLSKEYSMECLLSFIEFSQFLVYLQNKDAKTENNDIEIPNELSQSNIITNKETDFKQKAYDLYSKYIKRGCYYEINISGALRGSFFNLMNDYDRFTKINIQKKNNLKYFIKL